MSDDILLKILSLLPVKDAVVTSSLFTRWRLLWHDLIHLDFDGTESFDKVRIEFMVYPLEKGKYINQVNSVIQSYKQPTVHDLRICFFFNSRDKDVVDEWVGFAVNKKVKCLELDLTGNSSVKFDKCTANYDFPLRLSHLLKWPTSIAMIVELLSLKQLILKKVNVSDSILQQFLINSSHLQRISIHNSEYLKHIHVVGRDLNLKHFAITDCWSLESIYLSDFDLVSFTYKGMRIDLRLTHLPKVKEVEIPAHGFRRSYTNMFDQLSFCAGSLQALCISILCAEEASEPVSLPKLPNVKKLRLLICGHELIYNSCLRDLASIMQACPNLESCTVERLWSQPIKAWKKSSRVPSHPLKHLKLLTIVYCSHIGDFKIELSTYIIHDAIALEKIVIGKPNFKGRFEESAVCFFESLTPRGVELSIQY